MIKVLFSWLLEYHSTAQSCWCVQEKLDSNHIETVVGEDHDEEGGAGHDHDGDDTDTRHWKHGKYLTAESCVG